LKSAYIDSSVLVAIALREPGAAALERRLDRLDTLYASPLAEAEVRAALHREEVRIPEGIEPFASLAWVLPDRSLGPEIVRALEAGYLRGADLWHVAAALYLDPQPNELLFLTLDAEQRRIAAKLGFRD